MGLTVIKSENDATMMHHMAHARRHTLAREMPLTQRVKRLQTGATFMSAIKKAQDSPLGRVNENEPMNVNEDIDLTDQPDDDHGLSGQIKRQAFAASTKSRLDAEWQEQSPGDSNSPQSPLMHGIDPYAHEKFLFFILEETMLIEKDEGMVAPPCHCGIECDLHKVTETKEEVWICSEASCMYYQPCGLDNNDGSVDELAIDAGETEVPPQFNTVEEFWDYFDKMITTPEKEIVDFLISTQNKKIGLCQCGVPATIGICLVTGDLFWCCEPRTCLTVERCENQDNVNLNQLDIGQVLKFGESYLDRYTTLRYVMRWLGYSFSVPFFTSLNERGESADFPTGSTQITELGVEYDSFISYRGAAGRFRLFLTLASHFNLLPVLIFMYLVCPTITGFLNFVHDPCPYLIDGTNSTGVGDIFAQPNGTIGDLSWATYGNICAIHSDARMWYLFRAYVAPIVVFCVLLF